MIEWSVERAELAFDINNFVGFSRWSTLTPFVFIDVLFKRKDVSGYLWFGSRDVQESEGEDIPVNSKYPLLSK